MMVAHLLKIDYVIEQPTSSLMPSVPFLNTVFEVTAAVHVVTWLGAFGAPSPKPLALRGSPAWLGAVIRRRPSKGVCPIRLCRRKGKKVTGNRQALSASQAYPLDFGIAIADCLVIV